MSPRTSADKVTHRLHESRSIIIHKQTFRTSAKGRKRKLPLIQHEDHQRHVRWRLRGIDQAHATHAPDAGNFLPSDLIGDAGDSSGAFY